MARGRKQQVGTRSISHVRPFSREKCCRANGDANDIMNNKLKQPSFFFIMCPYLLFSSATQAAEGALPQ